MIPCRHGKLGLASRVRHFNPFFPLTMGKFVYCLDFLRQETANRKKRKMLSYAFQDDHSEVASILYVGAKLIVSTVVELKSV